MRSIPAHTGEPPLSYLTAAKGRVYPRTHGGTEILKKFPEVMRGLSPHTRGNHEPADADARTSGSIPAHTGEPVPGTLDGRHCRVYPRTHGGTTRRHVACLKDGGLSPHTRGNRWPGCNSRPTLRSIPAHTGEPSFRAVSPGVPRVYPRTHGGTGYRKGLRCGTLGLSPHTRGNHHPAAARTPVVGSIPAHTGEPLLPRSPAAGFGSIPAHTGEPWAASGPPWQAGVYPRTHGGTLFIMAPILPEWGLSPHTRGNLLLDAQARDPCGSIPAHTGEPSACSISRT